MIFADPRSGGSSWRTLSLVIAGGLLTSTLFTLYAVPLFYTLFDDFGGHVGALWRWARAGGASRLPRRRAGAVRVAGAARVEEDELLVIIFRDSDPGEAGPTGAGPGG